MKNFVGLSITERRQVSAQAYWDDDFREALFRDPVPALSKTLGREFPSDTQVELLRETDKWCFVLPNADQIDSDLPEARDARSVIENDIYALLRDTPSLVEDAARDPVQFVKSQFQFDLSDTGVVLRREAPGSTIIILPNFEAREELSDEFLDLVSAGGENGCQVGDPIDAPPRDTSST